MDTICLCFRECAAFVKKKNFRNEKTLVINGQNPVFNFENFLKPRKMLASGKDDQAVVILIDNSETTINGDFFPDRLDAQKIAAERLSHFIFSQSPKSQIAIGSLAKDSFGIIRSLTSNFYKIEDTIAKIERGGPAQLVNVIRSSFLTLHYRHDDIKIKRIVVFICSEHDMTTELISSKLAQAANKEDVSIDIIAFGDDVNCTDILQEFTQKLHNPSFYVESTLSSTILSDVVLSSPIITRNEEQPDANYENDPELALTLRLSMEQDEEDPEMLAAILASLQDENNNENK